MASEAGDVAARLSYGREGYLLRRVPLALGLVALCLATMTLRDTDETKFLVPLWMLIALGAGFTVYALWRQREPAAPVLVLAPEGIHYAPGRPVAFLIPWDDVGAIGTTDIRITHRGITWTERDVPFALVSERFYRDRIDTIPGWMHGPGWTYHFVPAETGVKVVFPHQMLSVGSDELCDALARRWRAFSRHPNAKLPPLPRQPRPARGLARLGPLAKPALAGAACVLVAVTVWWWSWVRAYISHELSEGSASHYVGEALAKSAMMARRADGGMVAVSRLGVSAVSRPECRKSIARKPDAEATRPQFATEHHCLCDLTLAGGGEAVGIVKIVETTYEIEYQLAKFRPARVLAVAPIEAAEAERRICSLRACKTP